MVINGDDDKLSTISQVHGKRPLVFGINETKDVAYADNIKSSDLMELVYNSWNQNIR